jgi:hypothetical protein
MEKFLPNSLLSSLVSLLLFFGVPGSAVAKNLPLKAGTYQCFTVTGLASPLPPRQRDDPVVVARRGARQPGQFDVPDINLSPLLLAPAAFGNIILDGKGGYKIPAVKQIGTYGFNPDTGRPTFTGDLGVMLKNEYSGTGTSFVVGLGDMNFHCGIVSAGTSNSGGAGNTAVSTKPTARVDTLGPALATAKASDFTGQFEGSYICSQGLTNLRLDLLANDQGALVARMAFGGTDKRPKGSYSMVGSWSGAKFRLKGHEWIEQPAGYIMIDLEGELSAKGVAGNLLATTCSNFAAARVGQ